MKKRIASIAALLLICVLIAGCVPSVPDHTGQATTVPTTTNPLSTTTTPAPTNTDPVPTSTVPAPTTTDPVPTTEPAPTATDPVPTTEPLNPELEAFEVLFQQSLEQRNPFFYAIGTKFSSPEELRLNQFFDGGFPDEHKITDAEWEELSKLLADPENVPGQFNRLPKDKMEAELQKYFGISLTDLSDIAFSGVFYLECTDCYCFYQSGVNHMSKSGSFIDIHHNDDGTISLNYNKPDGEYVITLKPNGDSYLVLSNVKAE